MATVDPAPTESMVAYGRLRVRVRDLLSDVDDGRASTTAVPTCPGWTVADVAGHMCGVCVDILEGNLDGVGTAPWADAQAERMAPLGLAAVLDRWDEVGPQVEALGPGFPGRPAAQFVFDATTHEHDIRGALGSRDGRDPDCLAVPLAFIAAFCDDFVRRSGLSTVRLQGTDGWTAVAGEGEPAGEVAATSFELFRSFGGRRSRDQFRGLDWTLDPEPYLAVFDGGPLRPPDAPVIE
jgi:uncharacterized protein (TIGR03083 family)